MTFSLVRGRVFPSVETFFVCCAALMLPVSLPASAATLEKVAQLGAITLGYRESSPPFSYLDGIQRPIGYSIDICMKVVEAVKRELKRPDLIVRFAPVTSASRIPALINGEIDLECGSTTSSAERRKQVAFTVPTFVAVTRLMAREGSGINSVFDLVGKSVVTTKGSSSEKLFMELNRERTLRASLILAKEHGEAFSMLEAGSADAFIMDDVLLYSFRAAARDSKQFVITRDTLTIEPLALMLRKDDPVFKRVVDGAVSHVISHDEIYPIYKKWFESPIPPRQVNLKLPMGYLLRDSFKAPTDWLPN